MDGNTWEEGNIFVESKELWDRGARGASSVVLFYHKKKETLLQTNVLMCGQMSWMHSIDIPTAQLLLHVQNDIYRCQESTRDMM